MAKQRIVNTRFWDDDYTSNLDPIEKLLFLYFLTNTSTNICGVYEIPLKKVANETGIDKEMVTKIIARFSRDNKIFYQDGWVVVKNFIKHQNTKNPKIQRGIQIELENAPEHIRNITYAYPMDKLSHSNTNTNLNSNSNSNLKEDSKSFDLFWSSYPSKTNKKRTQELWNSKRLDSKLEAILSFVEKAKQTDRWQKGFIKAPDVFLRNESWTDDLSAYGTIKNEEVIKI
jgi:hypothetical protein